MRVRSAGLERVRSLKITMNPRGELVPRIQLGESSVVRMAMRREERQAVFGKSGSLAGGVRRSR